MVAMYKPLNDIKSYEFKEITIRRSKPNNPKHPYYMVVCSFVLASGADELVLDSSQGTLKMFKKLEPAVKAAESIFKKNLVVNSHIQLDLQVV